jgi:ADP-L-glycero-D-manno-heptose 6-epimerase
MKNVLVTGTKGFIGKNLEKSLSKEYIVYSINEDIFDITDWTEEIVQKLSDHKLESVFHVGACSNTMETDVNYMMTRNYESTKIISDYCSENEIPMIFSSSASNYGVNQQYPSNLYGWSKYVAEQYVIQNGGVALRYFNVYGPGEEHKGDMSSVAFQMMFNFKQKKPIKLFPLQPKRDFVYIKDVIDANLFAFENYEKLRFSYYDVGSGESRLFEDVMNILEIPFTYHDKSIIPNGYRFNILSEKNNWIPNWYPKYNLECGLTEYKHHLTTLFQKYRDFDQF